MRTKPPRPAEDTVLWALPVGFCVVYCLLPTVGGIPFHYAPELRQILLPGTATEGSGSVVTMAWYGRFLTASLISLGWVLLALGWSRRGPRGTGDGPWPRYRFALATVTLLASWGWIAAHEISVWILTESP